MYSIQRVLSRIQYLQTQKQIEIAILGPHKVKISVDRNALYSVHGRAVKWADLITHNCS